MLSPFLYSRRCYGLLGVGGAAADGRGCVTLQMLSRRRVDRRELDDDSLKASIIAKYSYQDVDGAKREHKPHLPKSVSQGNGGDGEGTSYRGQVALVAFWNSWQSWHVQRQFAFIIDKL